MDEPPDTVLEDILCSSAPGLMHDDMADDCFCSEPQTASEFFKLNGTNRS